MVRIIVTDEQTKQIADAYGSIEILDSKGNRLGFLARDFSDEDVRIARQRLASDEERYPTKLVVEHLKSLEGS